MDRHLGKKDNEEDRRLSPFDARRASQTPSDTGGRFLNLFAHTGAATLAAALGADETVHVDASRTAVRWARENAALSRLVDRPIRWLVDDARTFLVREERRGRRYDGIFLDPPAFGRSSGRRDWKLSRDLPETVALAARLLSDGARLFILGAHDPDWPGGRLLELLRQAGLSRRGRLSECVMRLCSAEGGNDLPAGACAVWET